MSGGAGLCEARLLAVAPLEDVLVVEPVELVTLTMLEDVTAVVTGHTGDNGLSRGVVTVERTGTSSHGPHLQNI